MSGASDEEQEFWQFVRIDEYKVPETSVDRVRKGFLTLLGNLIGGRSSATDESPLDPKQDLLSLSEEQLKCTVPKPDWNKAGEALQKRLRPWLEDPNPNKPVVFYVAPPHSGREELLHAWASMHDVAIVTEPTKDAVLSTDTAWFHAWPESDLWLLPRLEKCYLRSAEGLDLIRMFLARLLSGEMGRGIVGCDSWAWSFLQRVWLGRPSFTITAQAFDASKMRRLFAQGLGGHGDSKWAFRQADTGEDLLGQGEEEPATASEVTPTFWRKLAAHTRGNIGVAGAHWQRSLRTLPKKELEEGESGGAHRTIWVTPWEELERPTFPAEAGETARFALHALLLHGGLDLTHLAHLLRTDKTDATEAIIFLAEHDFVEEKDGEWQVTAWGYPAVRSALASDDFLRDVF